MKDILVTVVEHGHYLKEAEKLLTEEQKTEIADLLAANPTAGEVMRSTGGFRKLRYAGVQGKGKSGGVRVIHFYVGKDWEVHLLSVYSKSDKDNLTKEQRSELAEIAKILKGD